VLSYLSCTLKYFLTLTCTSAKCLTWVIAESYAPHVDMRGHQSGAVLITGDCAVLFKSSKQKVIARSSKETELIAVDDALLTIQWTRTFM
jgi:hypothetical protein